MGFSLSQDPLLSIRIHTGNREPRGDQRENMFASLTEEEEAELLLRFGSVEQLISAISSNGLLDSDFVSAALLLRNRLTEKRLLRAADSESFQYHASRLYGFENGLVDRAQLTFFNLPAGSANVNAIRRRALTGLTWKRFREISQSAGVHSVHVNRWMPSSENLRVRRALLSSKEAHHALSDGDEFLLSVDNLRPSEFVIDLRRAHVGFVPQAADIAVEWQLDDESPTELRLSGSEVGDARTLKVPVSGGKHQLKISVRSFANHFVFVRVTESTGGRERIRELHDATSRRERFYHVATVDEPIQFLAPDGGVFRIDEIDEFDTDGNSDIPTESASEKQTYFVATSKNPSITLRPRDGQAIRLVRIFELVAATSNPPSIFRPPPKTVPLAKAFLDPATAQASVEVSNSDWIVDYFRGYGDSLTSLATGSASSLSLVTLDSKYPLERTPRTDLGVRGCS